MSSLYSLTFYISLAILLFYIYTLIDFYDNHYKELRRIEILEKQFNDKKESINNARKKTIECDIPDQNNPRDCYLNSNYTCKWNIYTDRCDKI